LGPNTGAFGYFYALLLDYLLKYISGIAMGGASFFCLGEAAWGRQKDTRAKDHSRRKSE